MTNNNNHVGFCFQTLSGIRMFKSGILPEKAHFALLGSGIVKRGELCNNLKIDIRINIVLERLNTGTSKSLSSAHTYVSARILAFAMKMNIFISF